MHHVTLTWMGEGIPAQAICLQAFAQAFARTFAQPRFNSAQAFAQAFGPGTQSRGKRPGKKISILHSAWANARAFLY